MGSAANIVAFPTRRRRRYPNPRLAHSAPLPDGVVRIRQPQPALERVYTPTSLLLHTIVQLMPAKDRATLFGRLAERRTDATEPGMMRTATEAMYIAAFGDREVC